MKAVKVLTIVAAVFILTLGLSGMAQAFHSGGVAECEGCHSMHSPDPAGEFLLVGDTPSGACLTCHGSRGARSYHIATPLIDLGPGSAPYNITPGGDFGWLEKEYTFTVRNSLNTEEGREFGHNIQAGSFAPNWGSAETGRNETAPGGTYPQSMLNCNSCHDPHSAARRTDAGTIVSPAIGTAVPPIAASGSYPGGEPTATEAVGVYRLLAGAGYTTDGVTFGGNPAAKVPSSYNRSEATSSTRVAYGVATSGGHTTWGNWCGTCHPAMHSTGNYVHPVDQSMSALNALYNAYVKSGDLTGDISTSFSSLAPFATNSGDYVNLGNLTALTTGPSDGDQVTCVSCHKSHASGFPHMLRFGYQYEFITKNSSYLCPDVDGNDACGRGRTEAEMTTAYGGRPATTWATYQRVLCNKCHAKD